jgi:hypothetical protein
MIDVDAQQTHTSDYNCPNVAGKTQGLPGTVQPTYFGLAGTVISWLHVLHAGTDEAPSRMEPTRPGGDDSQPHSEEYTGPESM